MSRLFWICVAGAVGTGARYGLTVWASRRLGTTFPYGTLLVNVGGCFAIAAVMHAALTLGWPATVRLVLTVGFLGGLTTYSSFNYETLQLFQSGAVASAALNLLLTTALGVGAGLLGLLAARQVLGP